VRNAGSASKTETFKRMHEQIPNLPPAEIATAMLLNRKQKMTSTFRKRLLTARWTVLQSHGLPVVRKPDGYEVQSQCQKKHPEVNLMERLSRATVFQLRKWYHRALKRGARCDRLAGEAKSPKLQQMLEERAKNFSILRNGCAQEIDSRIEEIPTGN